MVTSSTRQSTGDLVFFYSTLSTFLPLFKFLASVNRGSLPSSNSIQIVQRNTEPTSKLPSTSSQPVLLPSNPLLRFVWVLNKITDSLP